MDLIRSALSEENDLSLACVEQNRNILYVTTKDKHFLFQEVGYSDGAKLSHGATQSLMQGINNIYE